MGLHCFRTEMQQLGDLTYILAFADKFQDLKFTVAKSLDRVGLVLRLAMREFRITCAAMAGLRYGRPLKTS